VILFFMQRSASTTEMCDGLGREIVAAEPMQRSHAAVHATMIELHPS
jgi:hypothetical protein